MGILIPVGVGLVILILWASQSRASTRALPSKGNDLPEDVREAVDVLEKRRGDLAALESSTSPDFLRSRGVTDAEWRRYEKTQRNGSLGMISPTYNLGLYLLGMRVLQDVGLATGARKMDYNGKQVWMADWVEPASLRGFLESPALQAKAFEKMTALHTRAIVGKHGDRIGKPLGGTQAWEVQPVTLSGLLAVAKQAGLGGLDKWLAAKPGERFPAASTAYQRANGVF